MPRRSLVILGGTTPLSHLLLALTPKHSVYRILGFRISRCLKIQPQFRPSMGVLIASVSGFLLNTGLRRHYHGTYYSDCRTQDAHPSAQPLLSEPKAASSEHSTGKGEPPKRRENQVCTWISFCHYCFFYTKPSLSLNSFCPDREK